MIAQEMVTYSPFLFGAGDVQLFADMSEPRQPNGVGILVLPGAENTFGPAGMGRFNVMVARRLALEGFATARLDFRATGESTGGVAPLSVARPLVADVEAAARMLRERGYERLVIVGQCYGGRVAVDAAPRIPGLVAIAVIRPPANPGGRHVERPLRHRLRLARLRLRRLKRRLRRLVGLALRRLTGGRWQRSAPNRTSKQHPGHVDRALVRGLSQLARRGLPVLVVHGRESEDTALLTAASSAPLNQLLQPGASSIQLQLVPGVLWEHTGDPDITTTVINMIAEWLARVVPHGAR